MIEKKPFVRYNTNETKDSKSTVITIRLNKAELALIQKVGEYFQQPKISSLIKQLTLDCCDDVLHDRKTMRRMTVVMNNVRRNYETGVPVDMPSDREFSGNVVD